MVDVVALRPIATFCGQCDCGCPQLFVDEAAGPSGPSSSPTISVPPSAWARPSSATSSPRPEAEPSTRFC